VLCNLVHVFGLGFSSIRAPPVQKQKNWGGVRKLIAGGIRPDKTQKVQEGASLLVRKLIAKAFWARRWGSHEKGVLKIVSPQRGAQKLTGSR